MKTSRLRAQRKVFLIWDLDGAIGQINSTYPYNFHFERLEEELENVRYALRKMDEFGIKSCFAVTGFSAEDGKYPYVFPELIFEISRRGHEVASHSWRHEWIPVFRPRQIELSLTRSKSALEKAAANGSKVIGFVPPHNRPMTWLRKGALSFGDRGLFPFFRMGDTGQLIKQLRLAGYRWIRVSSQNLLQKVGIRHKNITGRIYELNGFTVFENHYVGFDEKVVSHMLKSKRPTYTVSAHPAMLSLKNKAESKHEFEIFLEQIAVAKDQFSFDLPSNIVNKVEGKP